jgi:hypothetical protein
MFSSFSPSVFEGYENAVPKGQFEPYSLNRKCVDIDNEEDLELFRALISFEKKTTLSLPSVTHLQRPQHS